MFNGGTGLNSQHERPVTPFHLSKETEEEQKIIEVVIQEYGPGEQSVSGKGKA